MRLTRRELLDAILEYNFACIELNLYLDNNPYDEDALELYNKYSEKFEEAREAYESKYGVLTNFGYESIPCYWKWVDEPWPWDNEFYE
ncbi:MAG: spore coat protein CotJB [Paraclostridium sp.]